MAVFVHLAGDLPAVQKSFFRNIIAMILAFAFLAKEKKGFRPSKGCVPALLLRAAAGTVGIIGNYYAIDHLVLSDASMLNKLAPFFNVLFSVFLLKEKISWKQFSAILIAFAGSLFIIKPSFQIASSLPALVGFFGGMSAGFAYSMVRFLTQHGERKTYIVFFFSSFSCLITLPFLIFSYAPMTLQQLLMLILTGLCAAGGQFAVTSAYACAPAREISVYDYTQILFSAAFGFLFFGQLPDKWSIAGYFIICTIAVITFLKRTPAEN